MTIRRSALAVAVAFVLGPAAAQSGIEHWSAMSSTAMAVTGDITLSPDRLIAAKKSFPLSVAADVTAFGTDTGPKPARILKVTSPADPVLLNGNTFCGAPVRWIVVYRGDGGRELSLAVFSGDAMPKGETDRSLCGTYLYAK
ncbi:hypothetical protein ACFZ8E_22925 [Methylobacterium sp. HMF5984]|uniref:hypothetical protein n=1 Tax=Methylobacterium sp. HMF5984 TaxID=3367370 RepID=UPI0038528CFE